MRHLACEEVGMKIIPSWGIVGASFESGALNWWAPDGSIGRTDDYPCSWAKIIQERLGLEDVYNFTNGSQTAPGWVLGSQATHVFKDEEKQAHPNFAHVFGVGAGGGGWDYAKDKPKDAYVIVLGSNDINNLMRQDPSYGVGSVKADCGTYHPQTDSDTKPNGEPGICHSYAGYMCAIIERLRSISPSCKLFVATIRHQFKQDKTPVAVWSACNEVVRSLPAYFSNLYVVDYAQYGPNYDNPEFQERYWEIRHPNKAGYEIAASCYERLIEDAMRSHVSDFI